MDKSSVISFLIAFVASVLVAPKMIALLRAFKVGQVIQKEGPQSHQSKAGTPAMGGVIILFGIFVAVAWMFDHGIASSGQNMGTFIAVLLTIVAYTALGFIDDWLTVRPKNGKRGIGSKQKFLLQFLIAAGFMTWLVTQGGLDTTIRLSSFFSFDLGKAYAPLMVFFIVGMANFINITDGLDGLASGLTVILSISMVVAAAALGIASNSAYSLLLMAIAGASAGFLWYNFNPAKVFMGDTGSLAIGVAIPTIAVAMKLEVVMVIAGMVFILDGLSSAVQWAVFKYTRITTGTGKRVFKMSPVHHHFELSGFPEQLVVIRFWIVGGLFGLLSILLMTRW